MQAIIIGFGNMGQVHAARFADAGATIFAVVDSDPAKREVAESKSIRSHADWNDLAPADIASADFFIIATPTHLHAVHLALAMKTGKPIFVEKPVVRTREEVSSFRSLAYEAPIFVAEVEQYNPDFVPLAEHAAEARSIRAERLVSLDYFLKGNTAWFLDEQKSGGVALDVMIHDISLLIAALGKPTVVSATGSGGRFSAIDDVTTVLQFSHCTAEVRANWAAHDASDPIVAAYRIEKANGEKVTLRSNSYLESNRPSGRDPYALQARAFLHAIRSGCAPYPLSLYLDSVDICLDIRERLV